jgi:hypothetical protein
MSDTKSERAARRDQRRGRAVASVRKIGEHQQRMTVAWMKVCHDGTSMLMDTAEDVIGPGKLSCKDLFADYLAFSFDAVSTVATCYKDLLSSCFDAGGQPGPAFATVFFEIDTRSQCATAMPLGILTGASVAAVVATDLNQLNGPGVIPAACVDVRADTNGEQFVYLVDLAKATLVPGDYLGSLLVAGKPVVSVSVTVTE